MVFLEILQNSQEDTSARVSFLINLQAPACNFIKKETLAQVFSCEFCETSKNTFFTEHLRATAFGTSEIVWIVLFYDSVGSCNFMRQLIWFWYFNRLKIGF